MFLFFSFSFCFIFSVCIQGVSLFTVCICCPFWFSCFYLFFVSVVSFGFIILPLFLLGVGDVKNFLYVQYPILF